MKRSNPLIALSLCGATLCGAAVIDLVGAGTVTDASAQVLSVPEARITGGRAGRGGKGQAQAQAASAGAPKLVVMLVVDQLRADALHRYGGLFGDRGFRRLLSRAAHATGHYGQQNTYTGPGHAVLSTGSYGYLNGVTQNKFYNRAASRSEAMMFDPGAQVIGDKGNDPGEETSPRNLVSSNLADELRLRSPDSRAVAVALKGRGSLLLGGHLGTAYFFSDESGTMTTSTYYVKEMPEWVRAWNQRKLADSYFGKRWERLLPAERYAGPDDSPYESDTKGLGRTFPHAVTGKLKAPGPAYYEAMTHTPYGVEMELDFVRAALDGERLGQRGVTDFLGVSVSSTDLVGHAYGPESHEYQDTLARLDGALGGLLDELERRFKPGELLFVLSADHGAVPIPEAVAARRLAAARIKKATIKKVITDALSARFGAGEWVVALEDPSVYLNEQLVRGAKAEREVIEEEAGRAALTIPGMMGFLTRTQLLRGQVPPTEAARAVTRSYFPARGGEVVLVTAPYHFWGKYGEKDQGSTHGSFYRYDTDVPVFFLGPWFAPGEHGVVEMIDVAATVSHVLRQTPPAACEGRPLMQMLRR